MAINVMPVQMVGDGGEGGSGWGFDLLGKPQSMAYDMIISRRGADI